MSKHHQRDRPNYLRESVKEQALTARCADLSAQLDTALELLRKQGDELAALDFRCHVHEKSLDEYAATVHTKAKRIAELEAALREDPL